MRDRSWSVVLWGAVVLCAASVACSPGKGGSSGASGLLGTSTRTDLLLEGTGLETLRIDEATVADAASRLGLSAAESTRTFDDGLVEMRTPQLLKLSFLPPESGQGAPRLYAVRAGLWEPVYTGKTSKGVITTTHPKGLPPAIYAKARAALGKQPDEGPASQIVNAILVVRPFTVTKAAEVAMARQQVISTRPGTALRISEF